MMTARRLSFMLGLSTALTWQTASAQTSVSSPPGLELLGRVRVVETDSLFLSRPTEIALGANGHVYVTEANEARVLDLAPDGRIARTFGRKGQGPGEFMHPTTLAVLGDTMLAVHDRQQRRLTFIGLREWKFERGVPVQQVWPPFMRAVGPMLYTTAWDFASRTSMARLGAQGELLSREGMIPDIGIKYPMLIQGAFAWLTFAMNGTHVYAMSEVSPSILRWELGSRSGSEIALPRKSRHGVDPSIFEQMLQDPGNNERNLKLINNRSVPATMEFIADGILAVVTMDYAMEKDVQTVAFHVTVLDLNRNRSCVDLSLPLARQSISMRDGIPRLAMRNNVLVILEQGLDARGESAPTLTTYRIDPTKCM